MNFIIWWFKYLAISYKVNVLFNKLQNYNSVSNIGCVLYTKDLISVYTMKKNLDRTKKTEGKFSSLISISNDSSILIRIDKLIDQMNFIDKKYNR